MQHSKNYYQIKSNDEIFKKLKLERTHVGYYNLVFQETNKIKKHASLINQEKIILVGMGGSSLGVRAIYEFLLPSRNNLKEMIFLDTIDPLRIQFLFKNIDLKDSHFLFISKSGNTIEVITVLRFINDMIKLNRKNSTIITGADSNLEKFANERKIKVFNISNNVGGRFSVFSVAGLVPLAIVGVDIDNLLAGSKRVFNGFFEKDKYYRPIMEKSRFLVENKSRFNINVVFSYSAALEGFNKWYIQLWAESLGKKNINSTRQGLTPIGLIGPSDQHSFLQLIMDGVRDKTVTFIKINDHKTNSVIPSSAEKDMSILDYSFDYSDKFTFNNLINLQADSTIESIANEKDIPIDVITISTVDEYNIGKLMFAFQLVVSAVGQFLQINTYDQPGVETGKEILIGKLNNV